MNPNIHQQKIFHKKENFKINKNLKANLYNLVNNKKHKITINNLLQRKKFHLFSPPSSLNKQKICGYINPFQKVLSTRNSIDKSSNKYNINDKYEDILNYNTINEINENRILLERPKVNVRIHSTEYNRNTISSEKNNNQVKCKIHKVKPKNLKYLENSIISPHISNNTFNQNTINYGVFNSIQNSFDSSETNVSRKNKDYSTINFYYNMMQEKSLNTLNNNIENLINGNNSSANTTIRNYLYFTNSINYNKNINNNQIYNESKPNPEFNIENKVNKIIYHKKKQKIKNNYSGTFSNINVLENDSDKQYNNDYIYNNKNKLFNLSINSLKNNKTYEVISYNFQTPNKSEYFPKNMEGIDQIKRVDKYSSILLPTYRHQEPQPKSIKNSEYIKIENNNNLIINDKNKSDTINLIDIINQDFDNKKLNKEKHNFSKFNYNTVLRSKKSYDFNSTKNTAKIITNNNKINKNNIKLYIKNNNNFKIKKSLNNKIINNINNNIKKNIHKNLYNNSKKNSELNNSKSIYDFYTMNNLNNSEQKIKNHVNNEINNKAKKKMNNSNGFSKFYLDILNKKQNLKHKNEGLNLNFNLKPKKLKNVITSIQYKSINNNNLNDRNIILSEFDYNGKLNIRVKRMNKSIENIIRENSSQKKENEYYLKSPPSLINENLTYVKKNQGTHIQKIIKHNTVNKFG